ncbi:MAG: HAD family hydrolase [Candidatus Fermentibacteraceae bacterium]|nr:HAD family hydrolase [Candidatus Fermentibacteraceae bacterium]
MDLRKYRAILFDLDGTLLDYAAAQEHAARRIISILEMEDSAAVLTKVMGFLEGRVMQDLEACKSSAIEPGSGDMRQAFQRAGLSVDPMEFIEVYFEGLEEHGRPLPGVTGLLRNLRDEFTVGVVTNGPGTVQRKRLQLAGLMEFLDLLVVSCEVEHAKPDPEIIRIAMKLAGSETFSTLFVGDSPGSDMGAANAAGVDFAFVQPLGDFSAPGPRVLELRRTGDLAGFLNGVG